MIFGQKFNFFFTLLFFKIGLDMLFNVVVDTREGFPDYKNFIFIYCQTSPFGHLYNTDTSLLRTVRFVPEMPKIIHSLPL